MKSIQAMLQTSTQNKQAHITCNNSEFKSTTKDTFYCSKYLMLHINICIGVNQCQRGVSMVKSGCYAKGRLSYLICNWNEYTLHGVIHIRTLTLLWMFKSAPASISMRTIVARPSWEAVMRGDQSSFTHDMIIPIRVLKVKIKTDKQGKHTRHNKYLI